MTLKNCGGRHGEFLLHAFTEEAAAMLSAIRELMHPPAHKRRGIEFTADVGGK